LAFEQYHLAAATCSTVTLVPPVQPIYYQQGLPGCSC
jgi:hypothetical protein